MSEYRLTYEKMDLIVANWQLIAKKYNGRFRNIMAKSPAIIDPINNEIRRFELHIPLAGENLVFKTSESQHFKLECKLQRKINFEIQIYQEDFFEKISKLFGMKEIEVSNPEFDNKYIIKSNEPDKIKLLLDMTIQDYMIKSKLYTLQLKTENESEITIMPFIREQDIVELEEFVIFSGYLLKRIKEVNKE